VIEVDRDCEHCKGKDTYCEIYPGNAKECVEYRPKMHWVDEILDGLKEKS
jgi:hypothetical protein